MHESDNLEHSLRSEVRGHQEKLIGVRAYELARDAIDNEILVERKEIEKLIEFQRDDLSTALKRLAEDGTVLYDTLGDALHSMALDLDRRIAAVNVLTRQSERMHYSDSLVPA